MKNILIIGCCFLDLIGCASAPRNKWTDKNARVYLDSDSIGAEHYVQIQNALVRSGKFTVVDRDAGMKALMKEQEREHRTQSERFENKEKWAWFGKMYGVGSVVLAHAECYNTGSFWLPNQSKLECKQFLSMIDTNTGEVFLAVEGLNDGPASKTTPYVVPDWNNTVEKFVNEYPKAFESKAIVGPAQIYQQVSEEEAKRQQENRIPTSITTEGKK